ncbi:MAG: YfiR family protein [Sedimentisphaerales bacterium]|nr:YfiR family protein [Sedimentisphaerales bacterium]
MNRASFNRSNISHPANLRVAALVVWAAWMVVLAATPPAWAQSRANAEYTVKMVFMYNFLKFMDWPKEKVADSNEPLIIGVIGENVFGDAFKAIEQKTVDNRKVIVKRFKGIDELEKAGEKEPSQPHPQRETIRASHLLFLCPSEKEHVKEILRYVEESHTLTVADTEGFLEQGGIINLLLEDDKVGFEINLTAAKRAGIQIRSKLLRLAKRTYKPPEEE